jgi:hypothetical protein
VDVGFRFQRRIKILPGLTINVSKSGVGFSAGGRGFHVGIDSKGRRYTSASLPGTGISWREYQKAKRPSAAPPPLPPQLLSSNDRPEKNVSTAAVSRTTKNVVLAIVISLLVVIFVAMLTHRS